MTSNDAKNPAELMRKSLEGSFLILTLVVVILICIPLGQMRAILHENFSLEKSGPEKLGFKNWMPKWTCQSGRAKVDGILNVENHCK